MFSTKSSGLLLEPLQNTSISDMPEFNCTKLIDIELLSLFPGFKPITYSRDGDSHTIANAIIFESKSPGLTTAIFGGIHGNELCGVHAIRTIIERITNDELIPTKGKIIFAIGNEEALAQHKRYVGANMNRQFHVNREPEGSTYEKYRTEELKSILRSNVDFLLDIHSTSAPSKPYILTEKAHLQSALDLGFESIVLGWGALGDTSLAGDTENYALHFGTHGLTMECGQHEDIETHQVAVDAAMRFLTRHGVSYASQRPSSTQTVYEMTEVVRRNSMQFTYSRAFENLMPLVRGELIGKDEVRSYFAPTAYDPIMILPGNLNVAQVGENLFHFAKIVDGTIVGRSY